MGIEYTRCGGTYRFIFVSFWLKVELDPLELCYVAIVQTAANVETTLFFAPCECRIRLTANLRWYIAVPFYLVEFLQNTKLLAPLDQVLAALLSFRNIPNEIYLVQLVQCFCAELSLVEPRVLHPGS